MKQELAVQRRGEGPGGERAVALAGAPVAAAAAASEWRLRWPAALTHPAAIFAALSIVFGIAIIAVTAPLRGPDEAAHFLRAYGVAAGHIVPSQQDAQSRKGIVLPIDL